MCAGCIWGNIFDSMCCVHVYVVYLWARWDLPVPQRYMCIYCTHAHVHIYLWYNHIPVYVHCSSLTSVCIQLHSTCLEPWCFCPIADTPLQIWLFWPWRRRKSLKLTRSSDIGKCIRWMDVWCCAPFIQTYVISSFSPSLPARMQS